jgi:hypothetical protein
MSSIILNFCIYSFCWDYYSILNSIILYIICEFKKNIYLYMIKTLTHREHVLERPTMYLGSNELQ